MGNEDLIKKEEGSDVKGEVEKEDLKVGKGRSRQGSGALPRRG